MYSLFAASFFTPNNNNYIAFATPATAFELLGDCLHAHLVNNITATQYIQYFNTYILYIIKYICIQLVTVAAAACILRWQWLFDLTNRN